MVLGPLWVSGTLPQHTRSPLARWTSPFPHEHTLPSSETEGVPPSVCTASLPLVSERKQRDSGGKAKTSQHDQSDPDSSPMLTKAVPWQGGVSGTAGPDHRAPRSIIPTAPPQLLLAALMNASLLSELLEGGNCRLVTYRSQHGARVAGTQRSRMWPRRLCKLTERPLWAPSCLGTTTARDFQTPVASAALQGTLRPSPPRPSLCPAPSPSPDLMVCPHH